MEEDLAVRVLLIDDQPLYLAGLVAILGSSGFSCRTAEDGFAALRHFRETLPDVIVCDLNMPNMSGFELLAIVRRQYPRIAVIVISGEYMIDFEASGLMMNAFFEKGQYEPEELIATIKELHKQSPTRQQPSEAKLAPLWINQRDTTYLMITCTRCLRSYPVEAANLEESGYSSALCPSCGAVNTYPVDGIVMKVLEPIQKAKYDLEDEELA